MSVTKKQLQQFTAKLQYLNNKEDILKQIIKFIKSEFDIESVAIRLKDGFEFPYYTSYGFDEFFIKKENFICKKDLYGEPISLENAPNEPNLMCLCGMVITNQPLVENSEINLTEFGTFWHNSTTKLLKKLSEEEKKELRNTCFNYGYESMALIPIPFDDKINLGLIQLNDKRVNVFNTDLINIFEDLAMILGLILGRLNIREKTFTEKKKILTQNINEILIDLRKYTTKILQSE